MSFGYGPFSDAAFSGLSGQPLNVAGRTAAGASGYGAIKWLFEIGGSTRAGASGSAGLTTEMYLAGMTRAGASGHGAIRVANYIIDLAGLTRAGAAGTLIGPPPVLVTLRGRTRVGAVGAATTLSWADYDLDIAGMTLAGASGYGWPFGPAITLASFTRAGATGAASLLSGTTALPVFPTLPVGFPLTVKPTFANVEGAIPSGRDMRAPQQLLPVWEFELNFETLREQTQNQQAFEQFSGVDEFLQLAQLFVASIGQYGLFLFDAWWDNSRLDQPIAVGDGTSKQFTITRTWGYGPTQFYTEPVGQVNQMMNVKIGGTVVDPSTYVVSGNTLIFVAPPPLGASITATFSFYYLCQFASDQHDYGEFFKDRWSAKIPFRSVVGGFHGTVVGGSSKPPYVPPPPPPPPVVTPFFTIPERATNPGALSITVSMPVVGNSPTGALIVVPIYMNSALTSQTAVFTCTDTQGNSYSIILYAETSTGQAGALAYSANSRPLTSADTISVTASRSDYSVWGPAYLTIGCAFFATNIATRSDPHESAVDNSSEGVYSVAVTTASPPSSNSLVVAMGFGTAGNTGVPPENTPPWVPLPTWSAVSGEQNGGYNGWTSFAEGYIASYCISSGNQTFVATDTRDSGAIITAFANG